MLSSPKNLPKIHSWCPFWKSLHHNAKFLIKESIFECASLILISIGIFSASDVDLSLLDLFDFQFGLLYFFLFAFKDREVHAKHGIFVIGLAKTKHLLMHFVKIRFRWTCYKDLDIFKKPSNFELDRIPRLMIRFGVALDHDPRDPIVDTTTLLIDNNQSSIGQDDGHIFLYFILVEATLLISRFELLPLQRFILIINQLHIRIDVSEPLGLVELSKYRHPYLCTSIILLKIFYSL